jgi:hypothetical protein
VERECGVEISAQVAVTVRSDERHQVWLLSKVHHVEKGRRIGEVARDLYAICTTRGSWIEIYGLDETECSLGASVHM